LPSAHVAGAIRILAGDYASLSSCSYEAIERSGETGLRKADLPASKTPKIVLDPAGVVYWELTFKEVDATSTAVTFNPTRNMWGSDAGGANRFWPAVQSCVSAEAPMRLPTTQRGKPSVYECPANHRSPSGAASIEQISCVPVGFTIRQILAIMGHVRPRPPSLPSATPVHRQIGRRQIDDAISVG
jgi:hypothetical protein